MIEHPCYAATVHGDPRILSGPHCELGFFSVHDLSDDTTRSHDVVTFTDRGQHLLVSLSLLHLWPDQQEPEDCEHCEHHTHVDDRGIWPPGSHNKCVNGKIH